MTVLVASIVDVTIVIALSLAAAAALKGRSAALRHAVLAVAIVAAALAGARAPRPGTARCPVERRGTCHVVRGQLDVERGARRVCRRGHRCVRGACDPMDHAAPGGLDDRRNGDAGRTADRPGAAGSTHGPMYAGAGGPMAGDG